MKKIGDAIATVATPIARALGMDCIDPETRQLRPESNCAKSKARLNNGENLFTVLYDRFFEQKQKGEKVKYLLQLEIETNKLSDIDLKAIETAAKGDVIACNPRPTPQIGQVGATKISPLGQTVVRGAQPQP